MFRKNVFLRLLTKLIRLEVSLRTPPDQGEGNTTTTMEMILIKSLDKKNQDYVPLALDAMLIGHTLLQPVQDN